MRQSAVVLALFTSGLLAGCKNLSSERIARWKSSAGGEDLLAAAVAQSGAPPALRAEAAATLVEAGAADRAKGAIAGLPFADRAEVVPPMVPFLATLAGLPDPGVSGDARDVLFAIRELATTDQAKASVDAVLFAALEKDLRADRAQAGRMTVKDILTGLGAASIPTVQRVLDDAAAPFVTAAEVLDKVGDAATRARGGTALVRRARGAPSGSPPPTPLAAPLANAIATLGGQDAVSFLSEQVEKGAPETRDLAAQAMVKLRRDPAALDFALRMAGAAGTPAAVRDKMFDTVRAMGGQDASKGLVALITPERDPALRYRIFATALDVGRGDAILPALEAMPVASDYSMADIKDRLVKPISDMPGFDSRPGVFKAMESKSPIAKLVAILVLENMGFSDDAEHIAKLSADKTAIRGLPRGTTVGSEAARAAASLKKRAAPAAAAQEQHPH
jgi:hypothetical protein